MSPVPCLIFLLFKKNYSKKKLDIVHWSIKSIYNGFAIAMDCTLKVVPFGFCSVQVMPLFRISFQLLRKSDKNSSFGIFWDQGIFEANQYTSQSPDLKLAVVALYRALGPLNSCPPKDWHASTTCLVSQVLPNFIILLDTLTNTYLGLCEGKN